MVGQEAHPPCQSVGDRPRKLAPDELVWVFEDVAQPSMPGAVSAGPEAELEEKLQVVVVGLEHTVVQRLGVVGVGAAFEQEAAKSQ
ncbi:MAG: hypothetical protein QOF81_3071 [Acidimicrobiaceae bacterium]|nr:hypothetical protein [Acidimicrobiaceae bacterium]